MYKTVFVVGPLVSQHIQAWYSQYTGKRSVKIVTVHDGGRALPAGFDKTVFQPTRSRFDFFLFAPVFWLLWWWHRPAVTNFHYLSSYGLLSLLVPKKNLVLNVWGSDVNLTFSGRNTVKKWLVKKALQRFSWINAPAEHIKQKLIALGAPADRIEVFQYGVDTPQLPLKSDNASNYPVFVSNRNWQPLYRIDLLVKAFCLYRQRHPQSEAQLHLYGGGSAADKRLVDQVLQQHPQAKQYVIVKGYTDKQDMLLQMKDADVFVSVPVRDGTPLSLLEAMYIGLLPVVSDIDANREWLDDTTALWLEHNDEEQLAELFHTASARLQAAGNWQVLNRKKVQQKAELSVNLSRFYQVLSQFTGAK